MVSATVLATVGGPIVIILIVLLILVMIARSSISELAKKVKDVKKDVEYMENVVNDMKVNVDINSEAVDLMIPWIEAAQETFQISGFGAY